MNFDLPIGLTDQLYEAIEMLPSASVKTVGTAAIALFVGLPPSMRLAIYRWAHGHEIEPEKMDPREATMILIPMLSMVIRDLPSKDGPGSQEAGPNSGMTTRQSGPRAFELHSVPVQREGYIEKVVRTYEIPENAKNVDKPPTQKTAESG